MLMTKKILQIVGEQGSGKTEICSHLNRVYGLSILKISDLIVDFANDRGISLERRSDYKAAHSTMIRESGAYSIPDAILDNPNETLIIDGLRVPEHSTRLKETSQSKILALICSQELRLERVMSRQRGIDGLTKEDFMQNEVDEVDSGVEFGLNMPLIISGADYSIDSSRELEVVKLEAEKAVEAFLA